MSPALSGGPRLAFVQPRYGPEVVGGSEALMREAARGLAGRGWQVEVLTTVASSHYTWADAYPAGESAVDGVVVRRFPIERAVQRTERDLLDVRISQGEAVSRPEQKAWLNGLFRVPELFHHLVVHADDYEGIVLSPYLFWTTVAAVTVAPGRTVVMPCLHDEPQARLEVLRPVLSTPAALWFLSEPEHELAHSIARLPDHHPVTGAGMDVPSAYDPEGFRASHGLDRPYLLFAGRREPGKGWNWLLSAFHAIAADGEIPFDLVTIGAGDAQIPASMADRVHDLGLLDAAEVPDAFAAAAACVQPSPLESFSRTIMEAWLAGTFVLATARSEVMAWHCRRSGAGLTFADEFELAQCLSFLASSPSRAAELAQQGRRYVLDNYTWDRVLDAMEESLKGYVCAFS